MKSDLPPDITPETHPTHHTVGQDFMGWSYVHNRAARYYCRSHDAAGYNMVNRADPEDDKNVSERAIGRTYHEIYECDDREWSQWGPCKIDINGNDRPSSEIIPPVRKLRRGDIVNPLARQQNGGMMMGRVWRRINDKEVMVIDVGYNITIYKDTELVLRNDYKGIYKWRHEPNNPYGNSVRFITMTSLKLLKKRYTNYHNRRRRRTR